jgi:hypothetical protein
MQLQGNLSQLPPGFKPYTGMFSTVYRIATEESVLKLYSGLTPGLQRQFMNCSVRFGAYEHVRVGFTLINAYRYEI